MEDDENSQDHYLIGLHTVEHGLWSRNFFKFFNPGTKLNNEGILVTKLVFKPFAITSTIFCNGINLLNRQNFRAVFIDDQFTTVRGVNGPGRFVYATLDFSF